LAAVRVFQVEECGNVLVASLLAAGRTTIPGSADLFQYLLSFICQGSARSIELFVNARLFIFLVFWVNILLVVAATGERLISTRGLIAAIGAATLAPFWDYGLEARHDNLVLTGVLVTWCALRVSPTKSPGAYLLAGGVAVVLQSVAFESFVYTIPIAAAAVAFRPDKLTFPRWKLALAWALGGLATFIAIRALHLPVSQWGGSVPNATVGQFRPSTWAIFSALLLQVPLLMALIVAALISLGLGRRASSWDGCLPEAFLVAISVAGSLAKPTPFLGNLVFVVPYAFLLAFRYSMALLPEFKACPALLPGVLAVTVFGHFVPFTMATIRHSHRLNFRQERLMRLAEDLTDATHDGVYNAVGMIPTRSLWLNLNGVNHGPGPTLPDLLTVSPPSVIIPNYGSDGLPVSDKNQIREKYVSLADDFLVMGKVLPAGGGSFEIHHAGRYRISTLKGSDVAGTYKLGLEGAVAPEDAGTLTGTLDGAPLTNRPVQLAAGPHRIDCAPDTQAVVVWVGPRLDRIHRIGPGDPRLLFYSW
jgi:hypothetical protein